MSRYIDADRLMTKIHELYVQPNIELWQVVKCVGNSPTADVVPKGEIMRLVGACYDKCEECRVKIATSVSSEIFAEIERMCIDTFGNFNHRVFAELKKKYTEVENELQHP